MNTKNNLLGAGNPQNVSPSEVVLLTMQAVQNKVRDLNLTHNEWISLVNGNPRLFQLKRVRGWESQYCLPKHRVEDFRVLLIALRARKKADRIINSSSEDLAQRERDYHLKRVQRGSRYN